MTRLSPKKSTWSVLLLAIGFFVLLAAILELAARLPQVDGVSPDRSVGNYHYQFETKWFRLQDYVEQQGGVDVIFAGSSLVNTGIDPDIVAETYSEQTGVRPRMFNFGVEGMTVAPSSAIAKLVTETYHPLLLVYVTDMRDYVAGNGVEEEVRFLSDPWIRYKLGYFSPLGWLEEHSEALQHYLPYRDWAQADSSETLAFHRKRHGDTSLSGYEPDNLIGKGIDTPPDPDDPNEAKYFKLMGNYQMAASRLEDLQSILAYRQSGGPPTLIVEMPVHPSFYAYIGGEQVHQQFQQDLSAFIEAHGGSFLPAEACLDAIPLKGRSNRWHLNYLGAPYFSECLGEQLAIYARQMGTDLISEAGAK